MALDGGLCVLGVLAGLRLRFVVFGEREVPGLSGMGRAADVVDHLRRFVEYQQGFWIEGETLNDLRLKRGEESVIVRRKLALRRRESEEVIDEGSKWTTGTLLQFLLVGL